jgi:multisubunit Na+/H+ antiporter MnhB subunit
MRALIYGCWVLIVGLIAFTAAAWVWRQHHNPEYGLMWALLVPGAVGAASFVLFISAASEKHLRPWERRTSYAIAALGAAPWLILLCVSIYQGVARR